MRKLILLCTLCLSFLKLNAQFTNLNWTFGDSCGIKFNATGIDSIYRTSVNARGTCATISDSLGNLLFYAASPDLEHYHAPTLIDRGRIYNKQHNKMENGDSLFCSNWYREMLILPWPDSVNKFIVISSMATSGAKISYSIVDLSYNNGLGRVFDKNTVIDTGNICDGITAIRHGNGRDWWILYKKWFFNNNIIYKILLTPQGLSTISPQNIGLSFSNGGLYRLIPSQNGSTIVGLCNSSMSIEKFSFDRCTGMLSNHVVIYNGTGNPPYSFWEGAISPNNRFLYVTTIGDQYLFQIDLLNPNAYQNKIVIDSIDSLSYSGSAIRLAPNGKVYRSNWWCLDSIYCYPFSDSAYSLVNTHLSVINEPDSLGVACNYVGLGQYLNGFRTYAGLPNDVNLGLGPLNGSICDTLSVGLGEIKDDIPIQTFPNPSSGNFTVNIKQEGIPKEGFPYTVYSLHGQLIQQGVLKSQATLINLSAFESGMYLLNVTLPKQVVQIKLSKL
ncbi:MAG: T9SS type A sorting domain-containing protein [Bacteroidetes bacterium]|nr:T9SS type A sorting domain-containing protein [Bacteroidota bacterium]